MNIDFKIEQNARQTLQGGAANKHNSLIICVNPRPSVVPILFLGSWMLDAARFVCA